MKRLLAILLMLALLFSLATTFAGCEDSGKKRKKVSSSKRDDDDDEDEDEDEDEDKDKDDDETEDEGKNDPTEDVDDPTEMPSEPEPTEAPTIPKREVTTISEGVLIVATNAAFPPYAYSQNGENVGIDMEIAKVIAEKLNLQLEVVDMEYMEMIEFVSDGNADICIAGISKSMESDKVVVFSDAYHVNRQIVLVNPDSDLQELDDFWAEDAYHSIGVKENTVADLYVTWDVEEPGYGEVVRYDTAEDAIQALMHGKVDCVVMEESLALAYSAAGASLQYMCVYQEEEYGIGVGYDNPELLEAINEILQEMTEDGTLDAILDTYLSE